MDHDHPELRDEIRQLREGVHELGIELVKAVGDLRAELMAKRYDSMRMRTEHNRQIVSQVVVGLCVAVFGAVIVAKMIGVH